MNDMPILFYYYFYMKVFFISQSVMCEADV